MNRVGLGLAIGAGYALGRTKKMKLALAVGSLVAGKRLKPSPKALADLLSQQLRDNPEFKELGDQLRQDLRGVGKAASGAMVERQVTALADRLHGRTAQVRDQLAGVVPDVTGAKPREAGEEADEEYEEPEPARDEEDGEPEPARDEEDGEPEPARDEGEAGESAEEEEPAAERAPRKKASAEERTAKKAARKVPGRGAAAKRSTAVRKSVTKAAARTRAPKGGGER
ncbi:DNA primase [Streptomyces sp. NPDC059894]|uniref:DNA primase n=1 Tax=unclassified Streptomyces TaxID=2593676 RepID=UPI0036551E16